MSGAHAYAKPANLDDEILRYALTVADALHGAVHAVHAYNPLLVGMTPDELSVPNAIATARKEAATRARTAIDPKLDSLGVPRARRHVVDGFAVDVIQNVAREIHAGIVVMGAVSRSGLKRLFIGNTAERLLDRMTCDVAGRQAQAVRSGIARIPRGPLVIATPLMPAGLTAAL